MQRGVGGTLSPSLLSEVRGALPPLLRNFLNSARVGVKGVLQEEPEEPVPPPLPPERATSPEEGGFLAGTGAAAATAAAGDPAAERT